MKKSGKKEISEWMNSSSIVLIGVSRKKSKFGNMLFREMHSRGKKVYPLHPEMKELEGSPCYSEISAIPEKPGAALICVQKTKTLDALKKVNEAGIKNVWLQQGSESQEAFDYCLKEGMNEVHGRCMMMFLEPVKSAHSFHRSLTKLFGGYPK